MQPLLMALIQMILNLSKIHKEFLSRKDMERFFCDALCWFEIYMKSLETIVLGFFVIHKRCSITKIANKEQETLIRIHCVLFQNFG